MVRSFYIIIHIITLFIADRAIYFTFRNFFLFFKLSKAISGSTELIFTIFFHQKIGSYLYKRCQSGPVFSVRCNMYISLLCYDVIVHLSVTEVHWRIIANLVFKFRSQFNAHCSRGACGREGMDHRREEWRDHLALC